MDVSLRDIEPQERGQLLELYRQLNPNDSALPEERRVADVWREILSDPKIRCLVAEADGRIVASCTLIVVPNLTRGARPYALIENVVTHEQYRSRGIGRKLLRHALSVAWEANCYKVMLLTGRKDEATLRFYSNSGFESGVKTGFVAYGDDCRNPPANAQGKPGENMRRGKLEREG
jgi:GNAT superfamily N-acetyltransferase